MRAAFLALALLAQTASQSTVNPGVIAGRILGADGTPAAGIRVAVVAPPDAGAKTAALGAWTETDSSGRYRLGDVPPGRYFIAAGPLDAMTYFPGVKAIEEALPVTVVSGTVGENKDFKLAIPLLRISGRVVREGDVPARQSDRRDQVGLAGPGIPTGRVRREQTLAPIGPDDTFEYRNLRPGVYQLLVVGNGLLMQGVTVYLSDKDVIGFTLTLPRSAVRAAVTVSAAVAGGGPIPRLEMRLTAYRGPGHSFSIGNSMVPFVSESTGSVGPMAISAGEYAVEAGSGYGPALPDGYFVESLTAGPINLLAETLTLSPGDNVKISIILGVSSPPPGRKVAGRVIGPAGIGPRTARIGVTGPMTLVAWLKPDGTFEFPRLIPGNYWVQVFPSGDSQGSATVVGTLTVGRDDLTGLEIPDALPSFKVTGRALGEAELRRLGRLRSDEPVMVRLLERPSRSPFPQAPGFRPGSLTPSDQLLAADGSFQFSGVIPGSYELGFSNGPGADNGPLRIPEWIPLTVVDRDIDGLVVDIESVLPVR